MITETNLSFPVLLLNQLSIHLLLLDVPFLCLGTFALGAYKHALQQGTLYAKTDAFAQDALRFLYAVEFLDKHDPPLLLSLHDPSLLLSLQDVSAPVPSTVLPLLLSLLLLCLFRLL